MIICKLKQFINKARLLNKYCINGINKYSSILYYKIVFYVNVNKEKF
jgi:hypothetical protein